ncbi:MAG TPA: ABC transporter permease [Candidatus Acidoferrum sp.]|nr:ABC transporter permease [Candidatus Acidoferrum sp.]
MPDFRVTNRAMFWRILRRLLSSNRGRLFVMLLALGAGAAVTAALLNLQVDAKRRLTTEFRAFGANVVISPHNSGGAFSDSGGTMNSSILDRIPIANGGEQVTKTGLLYLVAQAEVLDEDLKPRLPSRSVPLIVAGSGSPWSAMDKVIPNRLVQESKLAYLDIWECQLGENTAATLGVSPNQFLNLKAEKWSRFCSVSGIRSFGGPEDNQIFLPLGDLQYWTGNTGRLSTVLLNVPGNSRQIDGYVGALQRELPEVDVRPIRQFTEGEAKIYNRISGLLTATVGIVLLLTALCVMAAMTNVAMERKMDVGLMKAIGGATRRVGRLFLAEAALLGLAGGAIGAAAGIFLSIGLGKAVFGVAARPRVIVYPLTVALTVIVAILSAYPLRRLASIRPASVFRGEA